ncbi:RNA-directed DNA polymerase (Reverse transcriptase), partial [Trifolium medium]|nr:RNA-directed DNA polymerase (Reverse transcriptase) [Trifolium medium]
MRCLDEHKVLLGGYVLHDEADHWFKREFLTKYFPVDERNRKVIEFMKLKQGGMSVSEYAAKFK